MSSHFRGLQRACANVRHTEAHRVLSSRPHHATRGGAQFFASDGLPASMRTSQMGRSWYAHACAFMDVKSAHASPGHRSSLADGLVSVVQSDSEGHLPVEAADFPSEIAEEVAWIATRSLPLRSFASPSTVRRAMEAIIVKLDVTAAATPRSPVRAQRCSAHSSTRWSLSCSRTMRSTAEAATADRRSPPRGRAPVQAGSIPRCGPWLGYRWRGRLPRALPRPSTPRGRMGWPDHRRTVHARR
jgi:hypothetical protein